MFFPGSKAAATINLGQTERQRSSDQSVVRPVLRRRLYPGSKIPAARWVRFGLALRRKGIDGADGSSPADRPETQSMSIGSMSTTYWISDFSATLKFSVARRIVSPR